MVNVRIFKVRTSLAIKEGQIESILRDPYKKEIANGKFLIAYETKKSLEKRRSGC